MVLKMKIKLINRDIDVDLNWSSKTDDAYGNAIMKELKIVVDKGLAPDEKRRTLMHELLHFLDAGNLGLDPLSETKIEALSSEILYFIKHNKKIIKYLAGE
jgi:Zn-dependent peptidase ImmA (M78 family)